SILIPHYGAMVMLAGVADFWCHRVVVLSFLLLTFSLLFSVVSCSVVVLAVGHRFLVSPYSSLVLLVLTFALLFAGV
ncbi:14621_t:CDS:2, partial [Gigaspora rosea]